MAKPKIKLDTQKLKKFFIDHTEKIVLGVFGLIFLLLLYGIFGLEKVSDTPDKLRQLASTARQHVEQSPPFNAEEQGIKVKDFSQKSKEATEQVALAGYEWQPIRPPAYPPGNKRGEPQYLTIEEIVLRTGRGAFEWSGVAAAPAATPTNQAAAADGDALSTPSTGGGKFGRRVGVAPQDADRPSGGTGKFGGGARPGGGAAPPRAPSGSTKGLHYAVVLGLVPIERQTQQYLQKFAGVSHPLEGDRTPSYYTTDKFPIAAFVERAELVPGVPDDKLVWDSKWRAANTEIKSRLTRGGAELADESLVNRAVTEELPPLVGPWDPRQVVHEKIALKQDSAATPAAGAEPAQAEVPAAEPAIGEATPDADQPAAAPAAAAPAETTVATQPTSPYLLFRFFDFTAEEGKSYRYRVRLVLNNPNYGVDAQFLERPALGEKEYAYSPPSEPSNAATVPLNGELYAGDLISPTADRELGVSLAVEQLLDSGERAEYVRKEPVVRGQLINFAVKPVILRDALNNTPTRSEEEVRVRTNLAVLDVDSEASQGRERPADILVLDPSGRLVVRKAQSDHPRFEQIQEEDKRLEKEARDRRNEEKEKKDGLNKPGATRKKPADGDAAGEGNRRGRRGRDRDNADNPAPNF